jgi:hypothetical protein
MNMKNMNMKHELNRAQRLGYPLSDICPETKGTPYLILYQSCLAWNLRDFNLSYYPGARRDHGRREPLSQVPPQLRRSLQ